MSVKMIKLKSKDKKVAKEEGVVERLSIDAKELIASGRYEIVGEVPAEFVSKPIDVSESVISKTVKLIAKDKKVAKEEGVIERLSIDAKEMLRTGRYEIADGVKKPKKKKEVVEEAPSEEEPIVEENVEEDTIDSESLSESVSSMNGPELIKCAEENDLTVNFDGLNLVKKREAVLEAIAVKYGL